MVFAYAIIGFTGCSKDESSPSGSAVKDNEPPAIINIDNQYAQGCVYIYAGQTINVGSLCLDDIDTDNDNVDDAVQVCVTTTGCWKVESVASWFGCSTCMPPTNKGGNPIPGQFPYQSGSISTQTYCFTFPFSAINMTCPGDFKSFRGAVHLEVRDTCTNTTQTGWAAGNRITTKGNWGTFFGFTIICNDPPPTNDNCHETAFGEDASASTCFTSSIIDALLGSGPDINRWGWTNGAYSGDGSHTLTLRAGAAHCSGGTNVGNVTFNRIGSVITVTYTTVSPYWLGQIHFYAGNAMLPQVTAGCPNSAQCGEYTVAPGQYPYISGVFEGTTTTTHTFVYPVSVTGDYYVVAHAAVYGFPCSTSSAN